MSRYGEAIRERREVVGYTTATACANASVQLEREDPASFKKFSQSSLSRWELDRTGELIESAHAKSLRTLAYLLDWNAEQFEQHVGVPVSRVPRLDGETSGSEFREEERGQWGKSIPGGLILVDVLGAANGGRPSEYVVPVKHELVRPSTRAFEVQGDSMNMGTPDSIRDGDWVLVDTALTEPVAGKIFLLKIDGDGLAVKRLRRIGGDWLFVADNPEAHEEAWRDDQVEIVGLVYSKLSYGDVR